MTIIFVGDIFSIHEGRKKACCDFLAEQGYRVVLPDFHKGDSL
jgi:dienelactone hydrolase